MSLVGSREEIAGRSLDADSVLQRLLDSAGTQPQPTQAQTESVVDAVLTTLRAATDDVTFGERLALAGVTVELNLLDAAPGSQAQLSADLRSSRPHARAGGDAAADIRLYLSVADVARVWLRQAHVAMLIAEGLAGYKGPVRKLLRIMPIVDRILETYDADPRLEAVVRGTVAPVAGTQGAAVPVPAQPEAYPEARDGLGAIDAAGLLDQAAQYSEAAGVHEAITEFEERSPGEFWSIRCHGVTKSFGSNRVLSDLNFSIPEGMITVVLGPSGTGKSVLINHLIGLSFPDEGDIVVHGESLGDMRRSRLREVRKEFGILFQDGALFGSMSMFDNVAFPLRQHTDRSEDEIRDRVMDRLADVGLQGHVNKMPNELSGGMKKRAGFARALMLEPSILLFDEPDSGLDPVRTGLLCQLIRETHAQFGGTYVVITHDIASARQVGQYIAVLWKGRIVQAGSAERMFASSNPFVHQFLNRDLDGPLGME